MNIRIQNINTSQQALQKCNCKPTFKANNTSDNNILTVYGDSPIRTKPAQLSLFALHDFHGQDIRMERAFSIINQYDRKDFYDNNNFFDKNKPIDKFKLASGDMFLGENKEELKAINEFLNISGVIANAVGNHECDNKIDEFADIVNNRKYHFLAANMHPDKDNDINKILSRTLILESNGNQYGVIGLAPIDMANQMKRPEEIKAFNLSDLKGTVEDVTRQVEELKKKGINKIIVLSHLGYLNDKYIATNVSDVDVILGGHTHNLIKDVKEGENLLRSPKNEPVLIMQVGRDGAYVGIPNLQFNELGQITKVQYNVVSTEDYARSLVAKNTFEKVLGKPRIVGRVKSVEEPPKNIYANENPHCDFILDCMKKEYNTDIAIMNSANIRGRFYKGQVDTRDLAQISPFGNKVTVTKITEEELVEAIDEMLERSMKNPVNRPGILQVSGLKYEFSRKEGELTKLIFIDKNGKETPIDIENPSEDKFYTIVSDDYCISSSDAGLDLKERFEEATLIENFDKNRVVENYLKKHDEPIVIKSDGRIKAID